VPQFEFSLLCSWYEQVSTGEGALGPLYGGLYRDIDIVARDSDDFTTLTELR